MLVFPIDETFLMSLSENVSNEREKTLGGLVTWSYTDLPLEISKDSHLKKECNIFN